MADWKKLLADVLLADGTIDGDEVKLLEQELLADGAVDQEEADFLVDLRNRATGEMPEFQAFFFAALSKNILADGDIDAAEAARLRTIIFADGVIDDAEKAFLTELKNCAKSTSTEFDSLYAECVK